MYPSERKAVPWHSQPISVLGHKRTLQGTRTSNTVSQILEPALDQNVFYDVAYDMIRTAIQIVLQPDTNNHILVTIKLHGLYTTKPRAILKNSHRALVARGIIDIAPEQPFYIFVSNFFDRQVHLEKRMKIAQCIASVDVIHVIVFYNEKLCPTETSR